MNYLETARHHINPLHIYCRLVDRGWTKHKSMLVCKLYEILLYSWTLRRQ